MTKMMFCAVTAAIVMGAVAERGRLIPAMVFTFWWATLVYCPITCWVWNSNGWAYKYGVLDYAGAALSKSPPVAPPWRTRWSLGSVRRR